MSAAAIITAVSVAVLVAIGVLVWAIFGRKDEQAFSYPYFEKEFDVTKLRQPQACEVIDHFLISGGYDEIAQHEEKVQKWMQTNERIISNSPFSFRKRRDYTNSLDPDNGYRFRLFRDQLRAGGPNDEKPSYHERVDVDDVSCSFASLKERYELLAGIEEKPDPSAIKGSVLFTDDHGGELSDGANFTPAAFFTKQLKEKDFTGVYVLWNITRGKCYVGKSTHVLTGIRYHFIGLGCENVYNDYKNGDQFLIRCKTFVNSGYEDLGDMERDWTVRYRANIVGYNRPAQTQTAATA